MCLSSNKMHRLDYVLSSGDIISFLYPNPIFKLYRLESEEKQALTVKLLC